MQQEHFWVCAELQIMRRYAGVVSQSQRYRRGYRSCFGINRANLF
jgi:hypothetical protein